MTQVARRIWVTKKRELVQKQSIKKRKIILKNKHLVLCEKSRIDGFFCGIPTIKGLAQDRVLISLKTFWFG